MADSLFYLFAALTLVPALALVFLRGTVNAAMCMIVSFVGAAGLFGLLGAWFLAILQILVYAGAVIVLFLFIIMLLEVEHDKVKFKLVTTLASSVGLVLLSFGVVQLFSHGHLPEPAPLPTESPAGVIRNYGELMFTKYLLPFQVAGILMLVAVLGVIVLSKKSPQE